MIKKCIICGTDFKTSPSTKKVTCSLLCRKERCIRLSKGRTIQWSDEAKKKQSALGQTANLEKGTAAALKSPVSGPFETNHVALIWIFTDPSGKLHRVQNLRKWLRDHASDIPGTVDQAGAGFVAMKRSMEGKLPRPARSWKGFILLETQIPETHVSKKPKKSDKQGHSDSWC